eukprot:4052643-Prymnesium_polylepis.1
MRAQPTDEHVQGACEEGRQGCEDTAGLSQFGSVPPCCLRRDRSVLPRAPCCVVQVKRGYAGSG